MTTKRRRDVEIAAAHILTVEEARRIYRQKGGVVPAFAAKDFIDPNAGVIDGWSIYHQGWPRPITWYVICGADGIALTVPME